MRRRGVCPALDRAEWRTLRGGSISVEACSRPRGDAPSADRTASNGVEVSKHRRSLPPCPRRRSVAAGVIARGAYHAADWETGMSDEHVYKLLELVGSSKTSFED